MLALAGAASVRAQQIGFAEPVAIPTQSASSEFEAYGRHFTLTLDDNERVLAKLPAQRKLQLQSYRLLRGSLEGQPGSWVRLTEYQGRVEGAIWDGQELYAVAPYAQVSALLATPLAVGADQTVMFRLSDAQELLPQGYCALHEDTAVHKLNGLQQYQSLVRQLQAASTGGVARQIEIALVADSAFAAAEADPNAAMLARLNIVEGIFSEQVGLLVQATDVRIQPANDDPFNTTQPTSLLEQLGRFRANTPAVRARGLAHLMTGKNLDGTTAGIAYLNSVCQVDRGVSLSERSYGTTISALIMAHELGHNFGAPHDGDAGDACASVAGGYIMSPSISGFATFSQCSLDLMRNTLQSASCVTAADYADVAVVTPASTKSADGGVPFTLPFVVRSAGTAAVDAVQFTLTLPDASGLGVESATAEGASCGVSGLVVTCDFGSIPGNEQRAVSVIARGTQSGILVGHARVSAGNDRLAANNSRDITVTMRSGIDAALAMAVDAAEVPLGAPLTLYTDLRSQRALPVRNATLTLNLNQAVTGASLPGSACSFTAYSVTCAVAEIPAGSTQRLTVTTLTGTAGPLYATANITAAGDGDVTNNNASAKSWIQAERDIEISAGPPSVELSVGGAYDIPVLVRSRGPQPTGDVVLTVSSPSSVVLIDYVDAGVPCMHPDASTWQCALGAVAPGSTLPVQVRVIGTRAATVSVGLEADTTDDGYTNNNATSVQLRVDNAIDLAVLLASGGVGLEDEEITGQVSLRSAGRETASDGTLDVDLNAAGVLLGVSIHGGAECALLTPQGARCALPAMTRGMQLFVDYRAVFAEPGAYDVKYTLHAPGDTATGNDTLTRDVLVRPYNDISVAGELDLSDMLVGDTREATFTLGTARRALGAARFVAKHYLPGLRVVDIRASAGTCQLDEQTGGSCDFTNLAADARVQVVVKWRAEAAAEPDVTVAVSTAGDVLATNDRITVRADVLAPTDVELRVAQSAGGASGATIDFPLISLLNGAEKARGTRLEVSLPAEVTLVSVSAANAICSGTTKLRCDFADLEAHSTSTVNLSVRGSAGSYVSSLKLSSLNDTNPSNDSREVSVQIAGTTASATVPEPSASASGSGSGGGGGGRFEWLSLMLLATFVARKWGQS